MIVAYALFQVSRVQFISHGHKLGLWGFASARSLKMKGPLSIQVISFNRILLLFCTVEPICDWSFCVQVQSNLVSTTLIYTTPTILRHIFA